ncbi:MAG: hypothetical protein COW30_09585 [Rhodospirillales bacterium CG15_BIG_FIL_POST_REV_8_21_14_020_66_15]|nr:MAG: hypothetical protein COW30_09585 [Rhodospirillales bacterium CG15_BIG_FIL_POST_REV_8_21_14_020_66_15]
MVEHKPLTKALTVESRMMEPRLADLFGYWSGLADAPALPRWGGAAGEGFRLIDLAPDLLMILTVVDAGPDPADFVYRFWGSGRFLFTGNRPDPTGRPVLEGIDPLNAPDVLAQYQEVRRTGRPVLLQNTWTLDSGLVAECQTLRLPLGDLGGDVAKVVAATKFIRHADEIRRLQED